MVLQKRITVALTAVIVLFVVVQGWLAYTSLEQQEDDLVDDIVLSETRRLTGRIASREQAVEPGDAPIRLGPNLTAWVLASDGTGTVPPPPQYLLGLPEGAHRLHRDDGVFHAVIEPIASGRLVVQFDATRNEDFVLRFGRYLVVTALLCIALGWAISTFLARIVVAPFRRLSESLTNWSPGAATGAMARSDEETMLLQAFDQAQRRLEESLAREREFTANIRHEVKTPLAALRTDAEMLLLVESLPPSGESRVRRMIGAVDGLSHALDAVHALSRETPASAEPVHLAQCVNDVWESLGHLAVDGSMVLVNEVPATDQLIIDRLAVMTILRNLLRNVIEHASPGQCRVSRTVQGLLVADQGPGILPDHVPFVFDRYFQGRFSDSSGLARQDKGLGLAIARQTAELRGWRL